MTTGIFFHYQHGERLKDFPEALGGIISQDNVLFFDAFYPFKNPSSFDIDTVDESCIYRVHSPSMVKRVKISGALQGALMSASSTVAAARRIWSSEISNAFIFTGYGDHHAGSNFFGGGCFLNGAAIAIRDLQTRFGAGRFAILDTDAHHGDGTWELFESDPDVLYVCFCSSPSSDNNNNVNIQVPRQITNDNYLELVKRHFSSRVRHFQPEVIFWNWGYDGTSGEYGDMGLSPDLHTRLAQELKNIADEVCHGRLIVVLCGGSRRDLARDLIPGIILVLSKE